MRRAVLKTAVYIVLLALITWSVHRVCCYAGEHLRSIYGLIEQQNASNYVIMDTEVRIFHYVRPHKHPVYFCPECIKLKEPLFTETRSQ